MATEELSNCNVPNAKTAWKQMRKISYFMILCCVIRNVMVFWKLICHYTRDPNDITGWNMMKSSNGNIFRVTGHLCGEFTGPRWIPHAKPVTRSFGVFFDLLLNKRLSKQWWGWWFETLSRPLCHYRNEVVIHWQMREFEQSFILTQFSISIKRDISAQYRVNLITNWTRDVYIGITYD